MAFAVLIGSVPEVQVVKFQAGERERLEASKVVRCSHILASWVTVAPLNRVLQQAIDGGQLIRADLWHPWRLPVFHAKTAVHQLHQELIDALESAIQEKGTPPADDWYAVEIGNVVEIFAHAATRGEAIVLPHQSDCRRKVGLRLACDDRLSQDVFDCHFRDLLLSALLGRRP